MRCTAETIQCDYLLLQDPSSFLFSPTGSEAFVQRTPPSTIDVARIWDHAWVRMIGVSRPRRKGVGDFGNKRDKGKKKTHIAGSIRTFERTTDKVVLLVSGIDGDFRMTRFTPGCNWCCSETFIQLGQDVYFGKIMYQYASFMSSFMTKPRMRAIISLDKDEMRAVGVNDEDLAVVVFHLYFAFDVQLIGNPPFPKADKGRPVLGTVLVKDGSDFEVNISLPRVSHGTYRDMEVFRSGEYPEVGSTQPKVQSSIVGSIAAKRLIRSSRVACMKRFQHLNLNSFIWYRLPHISTVTLLTSNVFDPSWPGTILITGASGALSSAIIQQITSKPEFSAYYGLYAVRSTVKADHLSRALRHYPAHHSDVLGLDLTNLRNVRELAEDINDSISAGKIPPIRALVLNAGFQDFGKQSWTKDGLDTTFVANYLGHWLLTLLLLKSIDRETGRIIIIGSQAHDPEDPRNARGGAFNDPKYKSFISDAASFEAIAKGAWSPASEDASFRGGFRRYGASKLFLIMMQHELQARLDADPVLNKICVLGLDPGTMISGLQRLAPWFIRILLFKMIYPLLLYFYPDNGPVRSTSRSASDTLELAFGAEEGGNLPKDKYFDGRVPLETSKESKDPAKRELVWAETVKLAGLKEEETVLRKWQ
ncbi:hypothetical protein CIB48_g2040 [Xylaria polymorpha]|nr:hypothetical protein CIB48_g2040 [Xylaria polymorpha]